VVLTLTHKMDKPCKSSKIYIAGPMSGIADWNYQAFFDAEKTLKEQHGYDNILNPATNPKNPDGHSWSEFMRDAIKLIIQCDHAVFLNGWEKSMGANIEMLIAKSLGMGLFNVNLSPIINININIDVVNEGICQEADRIVSDERGSDYGHPIHDFGRTGRIWGAVLSDWARTTNGEEPIPPELVGLCMVGVKISREVNKPKRDNRVDGVGYFKCVDMIQSVLEKQNNLSLGIVD